MRIGIISLVTAIVYGCFACTEKQYGSPYEETLGQAGANRAELEKAVAHYRRAGDSLKVRAVQFLIENMNGKIAVIPHDSTLYGEMLDRMAVLNDTMWFSYPESLLWPAIDSLRRYGKLRPKAVSDPRTLTAAFLIHHIDQSFAVWDAAPWKDEYTFADFCEWFLPYRLGTEKAEAWLPIALDERYDGEDSLLNISDRFGLGVLLMKNSGLKYNAAMTAYPFTLAFSETRLVKWGNCGQMSDYAVKLFRSRGIPAATDMVIVWANRSAGHQWNVIIGPDSTCRDIGFDEGGRNVFNSKISKIYRNTFAIQRNTPVYKYRDTESIPRQFRDFGIADVTRQYRDGMPLADVTLEGWNGKESRIAYLATFDNRKWIPVAYSEIKSGRASFPDLGCGLLPRKQKPSEQIDQGSGIAYLPCYYLDQRVVPALDPVLVHQDGTVEAVRIDRSKLQTMTLVRKYPESVALWRCKQRMLGGRFEGSKTPDFQDAELIYCIDSIPGEGIEHRSVGTSEAYRYVRYVAADTTWSDIAEIGFLSGQDRLTGKLLCGSPRRLDNARNIMDGDILTYYHHQKDSVDYVGLDLGQPRRLTAVEYAPRTDDNGIVPGDTYELFYWDDQWVSAGKQVADRKQLIYARVPSGTLYWLRNLTKGKEERIFTYENGRQIWW